MSLIEFKVTTQDSSGGLFILENVFHAKGEPAHHLHHDQDEWFCALEGEFVEVWPRAISVPARRLAAGRCWSLLAPRRVLQRCTVCGHCRGPSRTDLIVFRPAVQMEAFFRTVTQADAMPPQDPALWHAHGMELLGPPLSLDPLLQMSVLAGDYLCSSSL